MATTLSYAIDRLRAFLDEARHVSESEFPYADSNDALTLLQARFRERLARLESFDARSNVDVVRQECSLALQALFLYMPLLGFILRSTNVRNAFEVFGPLLRLSRQFLDQAAAVPASPTKLLLSSEWDYSPLSYPEIPELPGFVLIGLPASESSNPLLIPLAGHELGHAKWLKANLERIFTGRAFDTAAKVVERRWAEFCQCFEIDSSVSPAAITTDLYLLEMWQNAVVWAARQLEETFCDCVAVGIFGRAYLEAFAYLLSPGHLLRRALTYPSMRTRVGNIVNACDAYGVDVPVAYADGFDDEAAPALNAADQFRLAVADETAKDLVPIIVTDVQEFFRQSGMRLPTEGEIAGIVEHYRQVVPAEQSVSLSAIVNAAWRVTNDPNFWNEIPQISANKRMVLKEMVLKNCEILEIEHILRT
jgi:hypothetical protein